MYFSLMKNRKVWEKNVRNANRNKFITASSNVFRYQKYANNGNIPLEIKMLIPGVYA